MLSEPFLALKGIVDAFHKLGIEYYIGGSVASSIHGVLRSTLDADLVADIGLQQVDKLVGLLEKDYYISASAVRQAIVRKSSFNAIHLKMMFKVDVFVLSNRQFDREQFKRRRLEPTSENVSFVFAAPEDIILAKLEWYKLGEGVSDRQWNDLIGVLEVKWNDVDFDYLRKWASEIDVSDLLEEAIEEVRTTFEAARKSHESGESDE
ncbi:MAG: hypothetical protein NUW37_06940 [Planctomycetes bacterium]|nr:hypothetical protein [Planctomycetota bacterium]